MRDYHRIISAIKENPWLITQGAFDTICEIVERHRYGGKMTAEELSHRLSGSGRTRDGEAQPETGSGVGLLPLYGPIFPKANLMTEMSGATSLEQWQQTFRSMVNDPRVESIVMDIDSPGGVAAMVPEVAEEIYAATDIKPIIAVANPMAASAALFLGSQASEFYVTPSGSVGSIGVIAAHDSHQGAMEKLGIKTTYITAGKYKAELAPEFDISEETVEYHQKIVDEIYENFVDAVARGRNTTSEDVKSNYGEGRMLSATMALDVGLVDGARTLDDVLGELLGNGGKLSATTARARANQRLTRTSPRASSEKEKEHSEPGTGLGGEPQVDPANFPNEDEDTWDKGERWDHPHKEATLMNREQLLAYAAKLGIDGADKLEDEALATAVSEKLDEALEENNEIRTAVASAEQTRSFASDYPDQYKELQKLARERKETQAQLFAAGFERLKDEQGNDTEIGLALPVRQTIEEAHLAVQEGNFNVSDLSNLITSLAAKNATIEFGERGSSRIAVDAREAQPTGNRRTDRKLFADKVKEIMEEDNLDRKAALAVAGEKYPELAEAYLAQ